MAGVTDFLNLFSKDPRPSNASKLTCRKLKSQLIKSNLISDFRSIFIFLSKFEVFNILAGNAFKPKLASKAVYISY